MKAAIIGYGRMGKTIERLAAQHQIDIVAIFDQHPLLTFDSDLKGAEVLIDFSFANAVESHCHVAAEQSVPLVEGTTGWYDRLTEIQQIENLTMIASPNFSIGVAIFQQIVSAAAQMIGALSDYDPYIHEWHHSGKADSPSGTALLLADTLLHHFPSKTHVKTTASDGKIAPDALHVSSTRVGRIPGTHQVGFDSEYDDIMLEHHAHGRDGFAHGALLAAQWIRHRSGVFSMQDFIHSLIESNRGG